MPKFSRRDTLVGVSMLAGIAAAGIACRHLVSTADAPSPLPAMPPSDAGYGETDVLDWTFMADAGAGAGTETGSNKLASTAASILVPRAARANERFPVLVALHGRGEARKSPKRGARGWPDDYALLHAIARAAAPPLTKEDYLGFVRDDELARTNRDLVKRPYGGLIVACPYVPDLDLQSETALAAYSAWIVDVLLPRVRRETPALDAPRATGIDGVSLGGAVALHAGFAHPEAFGALGTLQPAIDARDVETWTERATAARVKNPKLHLRLTTSEDDPFRRAVVKTSDAWKAAGIAHDVDVLPGPHDYPFNRGPGAFEMLLWHDRMLRDES